MSRMNESGRIFSSPRAFEILFADTLGKMDAAPRDTIVHTAVTSGAFGGLLPYLPQKLNAALPHSPIQGKILCIDDLIVEASVTVLNESETQKYFEKGYGGYLPFAISRIQKYEALGATTYANLFFGCVESSPWCTVALVSLSPEYRGRQLFPHGLLSLSERRDLGHVD